jgi:hypothetical protein
MGKDRARRGPTEDKALSYAHDRRNTYGENSKSSRKAIPKFKAASHRRARSKVEQALSDLSDPEAADTKVRSLNLRPQKTKAPDEPLGVVLARKGKRKIDGDR